MHRVSMISMSLLVVVLLLSVGRISSANSYVWYEDPATGHLYALTSQPGTWWDTQTEARAQGFDLVTINNQEENDFLTDLFVRYYFGQPDPTVPNGVQNLWIGYWQDANASSPASGWSWSDGDPSTFANWYPGEPNDYNGPEDAAAMVTRVEGSQTANDGKWNDLWSGKTSHNGDLYGIIENPVPEPTTALLVAAGLAGLAVAGRRRSHH
jgi:hypothetical protein